MSHPADAYMPFYGADFLESERVAVIEPLAQYLFIRLLWRQWRQAGLPQESTSIARLMPEFALEWDRLWPQVEQFFPVVDGRRLNERLAFERKVVEHRIDTASEKAVRMNQTRWHGKHKDSTRTPQGHPQGIPGLDREDREDREDRKKQIPPTAGLPSQAVVPAKSRKHSTSPAHIAWGNAWAMHREGEYVLTAQDAIVLNKLGKDYGIEALAIKADQLLSDPEPFVWKNSSPRLLSSRWNQLGQAQPPPKSVAIDRMREQHASQQHNIPTLDFLQAAGRKKLTQ